MSVLVVLEAAALLALGVLYLLQLGRRDVASTSGTLFAAGSALVVGLALLVAARGLYQRRRWARAPVLVVELLVALVAGGPGGLMQSGLPYAGAALCLYALVIIGWLLTPRVNKELGD